MTQTAMIVKLSTKAWGATRTDKEVSDEVAVAKGANSDAGRYVKNLVDRSSLKEVRSCIQNLRDKHKELTRPWDDDGRRLIPLEIIDTYKAEMGVLSQAYLDAVDAFIREYPGLRDYASMTLGELFNEADYPHEGQLTEKFEARIDYEPVPEGQHAPKGYQDEVEAAVKRKMKASADALFHRVVNALSDLNRKLKAHDERQENGDMKGRFRLSVLEEVESLVTLLPALNIEEDPFLTGITERLHAEILARGKVKAEDLRDDGPYRKIVIARVGALEKEVSSHPR